MYTYAERLGLVEYDNYINYDVGCVSISLNLSDRNIHLKSNLIWEEDFNEVISIVKVAWNVDEDKINYRQKTEIIINFDLEILINYLSIVIIFI